MGGQKIDVKKTNKTRPGRPIRRGSSLHIRKLKIAKNVRIDEISLRSARIPDDFGQEAKKCHKIQKTLFKIEKMTISLKQGTKNRCMTRRLCRLVLVTTCDRGSFNGTG